VFKGEGKPLNADEDEETRKKLGTGFRKRAGRYVGIYYHRDFELIMLANEPEKNVLQR
jgi:hypothetical protein